MWISVKKTHVKTTIQVGILIPNTSHEVSYAGKNTHAKFQVKILKNGFPLKTVNNDHLKRNSDPGHLPVGVLGKK